MREAARSKGRLPTKRFQIPTENTAGSVPGKITRRHSRQPARRTTFRPPHLFHLHDTSFTPRMMSDSGSGLESTPFQNVTAQFTKIQRQYQQILDRWTPHVLYRWLSTAGLLSLFFLRIVLAQGVSSAIRTRCNALLMTTQSDTYSFSGISVSL